MSDPKPGTFAADALQGLFYTVQCRKCRRMRYVTAKRVVELGRGDMAVVGSQEHWRCQCGNKGASITLHGHFTGPEWAKPGDWAETVDERVPQETSD